MIRGEIRKKKKLDECVLSHTEQLEDCFDIMSQDYIKMELIIDAARTRDTAPDPCHKHHIVPRSYFKKKGCKVDNSKENIVELTPREHFLVHYYIWHCSKPIIKKSMTFAFRLMANTVSSIVTDESDLLLKSELFENANKGIFQKFTIEELNQRLGNSRTILISRTNKYMIWKCLDCGEQFKIKADMHYLVTPPGCQNINCKNNFRYKKRYPKDLLENISALIEDGLLSNKMIDYLFGYKFANSKVHRDLKYYGLYDKCNEGNNTKYLEEGGTELISKEELGRRYGVTSTTINNWVKSGELNLEEVNELDCFKFLIEEYKKDPAIIDRIEDLMEEMKRINS